MAKAKRAAKTSRKPKTLSRRTVRPSDSETSWEGPTRNHVPVRLNPHRLDQRKVQKLIADRCPEPTEPWMPEPQTAEVQIHRLFQTAVAPLLKRVSVTVERFLQCVHSTFGAGADGSRFSANASPLAERAWADVIQRVVEACVAIECVVNYCGSLIPELRSPLPEGGWENRVRLPSGRRFAVRAYGRWAVLGWLTPQELELHVTLSGLWRAPYILEIRSKLEAERDPVLVNEDGRIVMDKHVLPRATKGLLKAEFPLLASARTDAFELAVSAANIDRLRTLSKELVNWKHRKPASRELNPNYKDLIHTYMKVVQHELPTSSDLEDGLTEPLRLLWSALDGSVKNGQMLAADLHMTVGAVKNAVLQIRRRKGDGAIRTRRGVGYWRPDAPPSTFPVPKRNRGYRARR